MGKIFSEILAMSVDSAWLIVGVIIVRAVLHKSPKCFRKILWAFVGFRLIIPFSFESMFSLVPAESQQATDNVVTHVVTASVEESITFLDIITFLWAVVGIAFLVYGIISYIRLKIKIIDGILVEDNVYHCDKIKSPFVCGFVKPKIYLPYGLDDVTQKCVLQHEKTHIKYADHIIKAISFVILCVHWFNPLVWVAYFMLCKDVELSCDESVVKKFDSDGCKQYAKALLDLGVNKVKFTACPVAFGEVSIKTRIKSVIGYKKAGKILVGLSLFLCAVVAVCFMTEPEVKAKESEAKPEKVVIEETTQPTTEPLTEKQYEETTAPDVKESGQTTECATEPVSQAVTENNNPETTEPFIIIENQFDNQDFFAPLNSFNTTHYVQPDPMREKALEAGVFADKEEKDVLIDIVENNIALDDVVLE